MRLSEECSCGARLTLYDPSVQALDARAQIVEAARSWRLFHQHEVPLEAQSPVPGSRKDQSDDDHDDTTDDASTDQPDQREDTEDDQQQTQGVEDAHALERTAVFGIVHHAKQLPSGARYMYTACGLRSRSHAIAQSESSVSCVDCVRVMDQ